MRTLLILLVALAAPAGWAASLNVTNYGAKGDAQYFYVTIASNSMTATCTNTITAADVGKTLTIFEGGAWTSATSRVDIVTWVTNWTSSTLVTSNACGSTATRLACLGTENSVAFTAAIAACAASSDTINIPTGSYLLIPPGQFTNHVMTSEFGPISYSIIMNRGGIRFQGAGVGQSILIGSGGWLLKGGYAHRGVMFGLQGPITNNNPLIFDGLTFDGGAAVGYGTYHYFPARTTDGEGWDVTHDAVFDIGTPLLHANKQFLNCEFRKWKGEVLKGGVASTDGYIGMTNLSFYNNNASCLNFPFTHDVYGCTFSNVWEVEEFYQEYHSNACSFSSSVITNVDAGIAVNGGRTNGNQPSYTISSNRISTFTAGGGGLAIATTPARNLIIHGNKFYDNGSAIFAGSAGYQGKSGNDNIVASCNVFTNCGVVFYLAGGGVNRVDNSLISNNIVDVTCAQASAGYGEGTNNVFKNNVINSWQYGIASGTMTGQNFIDDPSNTGTFYQADNTLVLPVATVSYVYGRPHKTTANLTTDIFELDASNPSRIPIGAKLQLIHQAPNNCLFRLSHNSAVHALNVGDVITATWNGVEWSTSTLNAGTMNAGTLRFSQ